VAEAGPSWDLPVPLSEALARLLREVASELRGWRPPEQPNPERTPSRLPPPLAEPSTAAEDGLYDSVLGSLRGSGLTPHAAALVTAIAVDARRIREELGWSPSLEVRTPGWRSLFDEGAV
jgi:hypothetical protein